MKKASVWTCTAANLIMLILTIIGVVKVSKANGFDLEGYINYHSDILSSSNWMYVLLGIWAVSYLLLLIGYIKDHGIVLKILMIIFSVLPFVLLLLKVDATIAAITLLLPGVLFLFDESCRAKIVYLVVSFFWLIMGIMMVMIAIAVVLFLLIIPLFLGDNRIEVYDKYGRFLGHIYED